MMIITDKSINTEFTYAEIMIIENLLVERRAEMWNSLDTTDEHMFLKMCQLQAKISGVIHLIDHEKKLTQERIVKDKINDEKIQKALFKELGEAAINCE